MTEPMPEPARDLAEISPVAVFYEAAAKRLDIQIGTFDALDTKAWNALSIGSAILPITFGLLGFSNVHVPWLGWALLIAPGAAYAVVLFSAWRITTG